MTTQNQKDSTMVKNLNRIWELKNTQSKDKSLTKLSKLYELLETSDDTKIERS